MRFDQSGHPCCPACRNRDYYHLGDGRRKCRRCGKKYVCRRSKSRLPAKTLKCLALAFWLKVPVVTVARELKVNPKTVRRHYQLMRKGINSEIGGRALIAPVVLTVAIGAGRGNSVVSDIALASREQESTPSYGQSLQGEDFYKPVTLEVCLADGVQQQGQPAWLNDLESLKKNIRDMFRRSRHGSLPDGRMLLNEAVFRFNYRNDPGVTAVLYGFFKQ